MSKYATKRRVAAKLHHCDSCGGFIRDGQVYLLHTIFPGNDIFIDNKVPMQSRECSECATRYGRGEQVA